MAKTDDLYPANIATIVKQILDELQPYRDCEKVVSQTLGKSP